MGIELTNKSFKGESRDPWILPIIVLAQFCCTSVWFATNGVMSSMTESFQLDDSAIGQLTSAIQFGFIIGTLTYALLCIADRFSPSRVFLVSALLAAAFNVLIQVESNNLATLLFLRFGTGFFLAGIYPVGMKIAADHFEKGLGKSLGYLVGALVLGTALPHLLQGFFSASNWQWVLSLTSLLAVIGGLSMYLFVPNGPYRKPGKGIDLGASLRIFKNDYFRKAAFGYFGHMWELYTFWAFVPILIAYYNQMHHVTTTSTLPVAFFVIAIGSMACISAGYLCEKIGHQSTAIYALIGSAICCLLSPLFILWASPLVFYAFLLFWGFAVIADSPMLSTLVAQSAVPEFKGTALTIVNCIGFAITIVSILMLNHLANHIPMEYLFLVLAIGPLAGLISLISKSSLAKNTQD
ncbi:MAG: MFS transporter [Cyclobacteriaceae bacterium]